MLTRMFPSSNYRDDRSGTLAFTLVEVLVVAVILAVLAAIAVPVFLHQKRKAEVSATVSSVGTLASMLATGQSTDGSLTVSQEEMALVDGAGGQITAPVPSEKGTRVSVGAVTGEDITAGTPVGDEWCVSMTNPEGGVISMRSGETQPNMAGTACYSGSALNTSAQNGGGNAASVPTNLQATAGDASAVLTWTGSASDGGNPISNYVAVSTPGNHTCSASYPTTTCTVTGLTNEEAFVFVVVANNAMGSSGNSNPSNIIIPRATTSVPDAPTGLIVDGNSGSVTVTWTAPANEGNTPITGYIVTSAGGPAVKTCNTLELTCTVTGLTNGITYTFTVKARNRIGLSAASVPSDAVVPSSTPTSPLNVSGTLGNHQVTVTWEAPASDGATAISGYTVTSTPSNKICTWSSGPLSCTVSTLTNGTSYTFTVTATNSRGTGAPSIPSAPVAPAVAPDPPTNVHLTPGVGQITVTWTASADDGGSSITGYTATASPGGLSCIIKGTTCLITGLANGTEYAVSVVATNAAGNSTGASAAGGGVSTFDVPGNPTGLAGTAGNAQVALSWSAPSSDGGTPVTDYTIERSTSASGPWTVVSHAASTSTSYSVTGLTNDTQYYFRVTAVNAVDVSIPSSNATAKPMIPYNVAFGGTSTTVTNYNGTGQTWNVHRFDGSGTLTVTKAEQPFRIVVVGGGGAGGGWRNGDGSDSTRGGGGGFDERMTFTLTATAYSVTVGSGGGGNGPGYNGSNGGTSSFAGIDATGGQAGWMPYEFGNNMVSGRGTPPSGAGDATSVTTITGTNLTTGGTNYGGDPDQPGQGAAHYTHGGVQGGVVIVAYRVG